MLDGDVFILELAGFLLRSRHHAAEALGHIDLTRVSAAAADLRHLLQFVVDLAANGGHVGAGELQYRSGQALVFLEQRGDQMLDIDGLMVSAERLRLSAPERLLKFVSEAAGIH